MCTLGQFAAGSDSSLELRTATARLGTSLGIGDLLVTMYGLNEMWESRQALNESEPGPLSTAQSTRFVGNLVTHAYDHQNFTFQ